VTNVADAPPTKSIMLDTCVGVVACTTSPTRPFECITRSAMPILADPEIDRAGPSR
jgi:hypothetical protein